MPSCGEGFLSVSPKTRLAKVRNSSSSNSAFRAGSSGGLSFSFSSSKDTGTSRMMVASCFDISACSAFSRILLRMASFSILPACLIRFSTVSYSSSSLRAVFSPTPGIPGILSDASPQSPSISITCEGRFTPNFSHTSFTPIITAGSPGLPGLYCSTFSVTSCPKSLSGVIMYTVNPSASAFRAMVPMMSSASYPSSASIGMLNPLRSSMM